MLCPEQKEFQRSERTYAIFLLLLWEWETLDLYTSYSQKIQHFQFTWTSSSNQPNIRLTSSVSAVIVDPPYHAQFARVDHASCLRGYAHHLWVFRPLIIFHYPLRLLHNCTFTPSRENLPSNTIAPLSNQGSSFKPCNWTPWWLHTAPQ